MSDSKKVPPPDDFSKTTPSVKLPKQDEPTDWEKTNYGFSPQPPADDWGKTVANYNIPPQTGGEEPDFSKTYLPSNQPKTPDDWAMTQANIDIPADFGNKPEDYKEPGNRGNSGNYEFTTPLIRLPEAERAKYQNLPPTPTEETARQKQEVKKTAGIPNWLWISAGLLSMFFFTIIVIVGASYILSRRTDFEVVIKNAPVRSEIKVNDADWGYAEDDTGAIRLTGLAAENKKIEIIHSSYDCQPIDLDGSKLAGETVIKTASCQPKNLAPGEDCNNIGKGEEAKAEKCARDALANLKDPPPIDDLLNALNLFIINFAINKFDIPPMQEDFLRTAAGYIQKLPPSTVIEIGGHTDSDGSDTSNQILSENRARAVRNMLIKHGVKESMLTEKGYGETRLKFPEKGNIELEKYKNRRIEYTAVRR